MNKKLIISIVAILAVILIGVAVFFMLKQEPVKTLNIEEASNTLANAVPFSKMATMDITSDLLEGVYGINPQNVANVVGKAPMMNVHASMYILIEAVDGQVDTVKAELEQYATNYEQQWERYLPEQYELVQNRKVGVVGNTVYMIVAENAETLEQEITK